MLDIFELGITEMTLACIVVKLLIKHTYPYKNTYFPMFPFAFKKHSAQVSFAATPLQLQP